MVEEEGEVFRKSNVLLGPEDLEGEYDGEELRIEVCSWLHVAFRKPDQNVPSQLLETDVERPPPRAISVDEFGMELPPLPVSPQVESEKMLSPTSPSEPPKPAPRPYLRRSRSSSSSTLQASPIISTPVHDENYLKGIQSPVMMSPTTPMSPALTQSVSAGPTPYLPRRRSSSSNFSSPVP